MTGQAPFAIVTGASTGIGLELARCCSKAGFDLLIAADEPATEASAAMPQNSQQARHSMLGRVPGYQGGSDPPAHDPATQCSGRR